MRSLPVKDYYEYARSLLQRNGDFRKHEIPTEGSLLANVMLPHMTFLPQSGQPSLAGFVFVVPEDVSIAEHNEITMKVSWNNQIAFLPNEEFCQCRTLARHLDQRRNVMKDVYHFRFFRDMVFPRLREEDIDSVINWINLGDGNDKKVEEAYARVLEYEDIDTSDAFVFAPFK